MLKKDFRRKKRKGGKMDPQWLGPYKVAKDLGKGFYALESLQDGSIVIERINGAHLKVYLTPPSSIDHQSLSSFSATVSILTLMELHNLKEYT